MQSNRHSVLGFKRSPLIPEPVLDLHSQNLRIETDSTVHVRYEYRHYCHGSSLRRFASTLGSAARLCKCHFARKEVPYSAATKPMAKHARTTKPPSLQ